jgi:hypothetical protein
MNDETHSGSAQSHCSRSEDELFDKQLLADEQAFYLGRNKMTFCKTSRGGAPTSQPQQEDSITMTTTPTTRAIVVTTLDDGEGTISTKSNDLYE